MRTIGASYRDLLHSINAHDFVCALRCNAAPKRFLYAVGQLSVLPSSNLEVSRQLVIESADAPTPRSSHEYVCKYNHHDGHCCEYKCVGSKDSCHALPGGKVESSAGGHAYEDSDGALGRKALASAAAVLAGLAF